MTLQRLHVQSDRAFARRAVRELLLGDGKKNPELQAARAALGVDDDQPILCPGHPVVDAVVAAGGSIGSIYIPDNTKHTSVIADLSIPIFQQFHELICK
jgi:hypothetical protein